MRGLSKTIKQKSQTRLAILESKRPTHTEGTGIPITQEAQDMIHPWQEALARLDGKTLHYEDIPSPGCIYKNHDVHREIIITESVWFKAIGDALAQSTEDRRLACIESGNVLQSEPVVLDACVAQKIIEILKAYGIPV